MGLADLACVAQQECTVEAFLWASGVESYECR